MFSYLLNELLLFKINLLFVELLNYKLCCCKTKSVGKTPEFILILASLPQEP